MASELELRWLKVTELKGAAKHFALFCKEDILRQADQEDFDLSVYQDAAKLIISKLDRSQTLEKLSKRIAAEAEELSATEGPETIDAETNNTETNNAETLENLSSESPDIIENKISNQDPRISGEPSNAD